MPSVDHELLVTLFQEQPALVVPLLQLHGVEVPVEATAKLANASLSDPVSALLPDAVVLLSRRGRPCLALVVEVQLARKTAKRFSWPHYEAAARRRHRCPSSVLVITPKPKVARWAQRPIKLGPSDSTSLPIVLGPEALARLAEKGALTSPEQAYLAALALAEDPVHGAPAAARALPLLNQLPSGRGEVYFDHLMGALAPLVRTALETLMPTLNGKPYEYRSTYMRRAFREGEKRGEARGKAEGKAEGLAKAILLVLEGRSVALEDEAKNRILGNHNVRRLERWLRAAMTVESVDVLFARR